MLRIPGMPLLPGGQFRDVTKTRHPRPQSLLHYQGLHMLNDRRGEPELVEPNGILYDPKCPVRPAQYTTLYNTKNHSRLPPWLAYDKQVLCFYAHFKEPLQEIYHAPYQVRKVKIYFYLEDGTMQVTEPKVENSGIPQGCLVHRQRIPSNGKANGYEFLSLFNLNVDQDIKIFDRTYLITGCDTFTRQFLTRGGISVPAPLEEPKDPTTEFRKRATIKKPPPSAPPRKHAFAQFLEYDRKVLKFQGYWNDRSEYGDVRKLEICYYLADDTLDIKEKFPRNSGREGPATFLKRDKLPKEFSGLALPGEQTSQTLLNVLGNNMRDVRYVTDSLNTGKKDLNYYTDKDLRIGAVLNVFGRKVVLTSCDGFTKNYYREKYAIKEFNPAPIPDTSDERHYGKGKRILPPYNGWGSHEDSEGNCISVEPKAPQADFNKIMKYDGCILRFGAKLHSPIRENCERNFVISYYLADDTIQIYEAAARNSGFVGGDFLKRSRVPVPGQDRFSSNRPKYYKPNDFYIGATMSLKDHVFHVVSADEFTLLYMEHHPDEFHVANVRGIMERVRRALRPCYKEFVLHCKPDADLGDFTTIPYARLRAALNKFMSNSLINQEILTICRYFSAEQQVTPSCDRETVRAAAQLELKRALWNNMDELTGHLEHINPAHKPYITESQVRSTLRGCRLPFSLELIEDILKVLRHGSNNQEVEVQDFLRFFNMRADNVPDIAPINIAFELCPKLPFLHKGHIVDFIWFLDYLGLEEELKRQNN